MAYCDQLSLYVRRILRDVPRYHEDIYIEKQINADIHRLYADKFGSAKPTRSEIKQLPRVRKLARQYRAAYRDSAQRISGLMLFNRTFMNLFGIAIILLAAFAVFRLSPTTEYVAFAVCGAAGAAAALYGYFRFYKLRYSLATVLLPAFFLVYYPARDCLSAYFKQGVPFWSSLFSYHYHEVWFIILFSAIFFTTVTSLLHAFTYVRGSRRIISCVLTAALLAGFLSGFSAYAIQLRRDYNASAEIALSRFSEVYGNYIAGDSILPCIDAAEDCVELADRYASIYIPPDEQTSGAASRLIYLLLLGDYSVSDLTLYLHTSYKPEEDRGVSTVSVEKSLVFVRQSLAAQLAINYGSEPFRALLDVETRCNSLANELTEIVRLYYEDWIYAEVAE